MKKFWSLAIIGATLACGLTACNNTNGGDSTSNNTSDGDSTSTTIPTDSTTSDGDSTTVPITPVEYKLDFTTLDGNSTVENAFSAD